MVIFEALQALQGDCLVVTLPSSGGGIRRWLIDGGPGSGPRAGWAGAADTTRVAPWRQVLLPHLGWVAGDPPVEIDLAVCTHVDDDHIEGLRILVEKQANGSLVDPEPIRFRAVWFNSLSAILADGGGAAATQAIGAEIVAAATTVGAIATGNAPVPGSILDRRSPQAMVQSIAQGVGLESDLKCLGLDGNPPFGGPVRSGPRAVGGSPRIALDGVLVTVLGPRATRLAKLRKAWTEALAEKDAKKRATAISNSFLPTSALDDAYPNLSSIVMLVEAEGRRLLLTGDALGEDIVASWRDDLGHGTEICPVDVLKLPHHGSLRNVSKAFLETFPADHYVFSANGKYENPDAPTIEDVVAAAAGRAITLHFTNADVVWPTPYGLERADPATGIAETAADLPSLLAALGRAYGPSVRWSARDPGATALRIELAPVP